MGMTTKEYLSQIKRFNKMIKNKQQEMYYLEAMACSVTGGSNDEDKVQTSIDKDKMGVIVAEIVDMDKEVKVLFAKRDAIVKEINSIENIDMYDVLAGHYILDKPLKVIAIECDRTNRHIIRLHSDALELFESKFGEKYL